VRLSISLGESCGQAAAPSTIERNGLAARSLTLPVCENSPVIARFASMRAISGAWNPYKLPYRIVRALSDENHNSAWPHCVSKSLDNLLLVGIRDIVRISLVSIARVQEMPGKIGSSNSCGSQYAFAIR